MKKGRMVCPKTMSRKHYWVPFAEGGIWCKGAIFVKGTRSCVVCGMIDDTKPKKSE